MDRVARDPFAPPSRVRLRVDAAVAGFPPELFRNRVRRIGLSDYLARRVDQAIPRSENRSGSGNSGVVRVDAGRQEVLERTAVHIFGDGTEPASVEARLEVGLPAAGRRILGHRAADLLAGELPGSPGRRSFFRNLPDGGASSFGTSSKIRNTSAPNSAPGAWRPSSPTARCSRARTVLANARSATGSSLSRARPRCG